MAGLNLGNSFGRTGNPGGRAWRFFTRRRVAMALLIAVALLVVGSALGTGLSLPERSSPAGTNDTRSNAPAAPTTAAAAYDAAGGASASAPPSTTQQNQSADQAWDRMIIRTGTLQLSVKDVLASMDQIRALAQGHAGYVMQTDSHQDGDYTIGTITIQVPAKEFDSIFPELRKLGVKTVQQTVTSSDVTDEYTDLQSQLRNLQATEQRLLALQAKADNLQDILTLDQQLRQVQGNIEQIQGRVNYLSKSSAMSTITISLYPDVPEAQPAPPSDGWNPSTIASNAWNASLQLLSGVANVVITVVVFMWWSVPLLLLAVWLALRPRRRTELPTTPAASGD